MLVGIEQGNGDVIQFGRYLAKLADQGAQIRCPMLADLQPLFDAAFPAIAFGPVMPGNSFDFHIPLLSVPAILNLDGEAAVLSRAPYLRVAPEATKKWRQTLPEGPTSASPGRATRKTSATGAARSTIWSL